MNVWRQKIKTPRDGHIWLEASTLHIMGEWHWPHCFSVTQIDKERQRQRARARAFAWQLCCPFYIFILLGCLALCLVPCALCLAKWPWSMAWHGMAWCVCMCVWASCHRDKAIDCPNERITLDISSILVCGVDLCIACSYLFIRSISIANTGFISPSTHMKRKARTESKTSNEDVFLSWSFYLLLFHCTPKERMAQFHSACQAGVLNTHVDMNMWIWIWCHPSIQGPGHILAYDISLSLCIGPKGYFRVNKLEHCGHADKLIFCVLFACTFVICPKPPYQPSLTKPCHAIPYRTIQTQGYTQRAF